MGSIKVGVAVSVLLLAESVWDRSILPLIESDLSFILFLPVSVALPVVLSLVFSVRRQNVYFDVFAPLLLSLVFFLGFGHIYEYGGARLLLLVIVIPLLIRLPDTRFRRLSRISWRDIYAFFIVMFAAGIFSEYAIDHHLVKNMILGSLILVALAAYMIFFILIIPQVFLYSYPLYALAYWIGSGKKRYYDFALSTAAFVVIAWQATPAYELFAQRFIDPCYKKANAYGESKYKALPEDGLVCFAPKGRGAYGMSVFQTLEGADAKTFEDFGSMYAKDKRHVYHDGRVISDDAGHFEYLGDEYARDGRRVYYGGEALDVDFGTFSKLPNSGFALDAKGLISAGRYFDEDWSYVNKAKHFALRYPKSYDPYRQYDEPYVIATPFRFTDNECHGTMFWLPESHDLEFSVTVLWPSRCAVLQEKRNLTRGEIDGISGERYITHDGAEETDIVYGNYRYVIRTKGEWHERMLPKFSFLKNER